MNKILDTQTAADRLGVIARRVRQLIKSGALPATRLGARSWAIREEDLKLVADRPKPGPKPGSKRIPKIPRKKTK